MKHYLVFSKGDAITLLEIGCSTCNLEKKQLLSQGFWQSEHVVSAANTATAMQKYEALTNSYCKVEDSYFGVEPASLHAASVSTLCH